MYEGTNATLLPRTSVYYSVIDSWTIILNENEKYKSEESPMRLFYTMADLVTFISFIYSVKMLNINFI